MPDLATNMASGVAAASLSLADAQFPDEADDDEVKKSPLQKLFMMLSFGLAAATAVFGGIAMATNQAGIVIVAFVLGIVDSGYVVIQRVQLIKMETLREVMNKLRQDINRLSGINDELTAQNDELKVQVDKVKEVEAGLSDIVTRQGQSVEVFVEAVKANQTTIDAMKDLMKAKILQDLVTIVLRSDIDRDSHIDPNEINMLVMFLKNAQAVTLDEEKFKAKMDERGYALASVLAICKELVHQESEDEAENVIKVDPKKIHLSDL